MEPFNARLKAARQQRGKSPKEIANAIGISVESYYDLEDSDEFARVLSLREFLQLCDAVSLSPVDLLGWQSTDLTAINPETLRCRMRDYINANSLSIGSLEDIVGFQLAPFMADIDEFYDWNLDCLKAVCKTIGVDPADALAALHTARRPDVSTSNK